MKFDFKTKMKSVDDDLISELISKAEEAMVHPLKKSKVEVVEVDGEPEEEESEDSESPEVESEEEDSIDEEDLKKLLEMYKQIKE